MAHVASLKPPSSTTARQILPVLCLISRPVFTAALAEHGFPVARINRMSTMNMARRLVTVERGSK
jgi:hypothetical protein